MAEKRVSVRLAAVGGRQVRSELEGVGEAGKRGFGRLGAFGAAENAVADFVRKGKLDFRDLVTSMIADLARLAARRFILGPLEGPIFSAQANDLSPFPVKLNTDCPQYSEVQQQNG